VDRIDRELETTAAPDAVWAAVTDPDGLAAWLDAEVELELRPGGPGHFRFADGEFRRAMVQEIVPGQELTFSWWPIAGPDTLTTTGPDTGAMTTVTITVEPIPTGGSRVRFREVAALRARARVRAAA
jgi:uncharacterized protein YndB with AHSA1/START domain